MHSSCESVSRPRNSSRLQRVPRPSRANGRHLDAVTVCPSMRGRWRRRSSRKTQTDWSPHTAADGIPAGRSTLRVRNPGRYADSTVGMIISDYRGGRQFLHPPRATNRSHCGCASVHGRTREEGRPTLLCFGDSGGRHVDVRSSINATGLPLDPTVTLYDSAGQIVASRRTCTVKPAAGH
jgi:hypothetical protein